MHDLAHETFALFIFEPLNAVKTVPHHLPPHGQPPITDRKVPRSGSSNGQLPTKVRWAVWPHNQPQRAAEQAETLCFKSDGKQSVWSGNAYKLSKKIRKNSYIYLDVMDKLSTFAPALLERQSLMIDILLMIKGSENKNKKLRKKFGCYLKKSLSLHPLS